MVGVTLMLGITCTGLGAGALEAAAAAAAELLLRRRRRPAAAAAIAGPLAAG